MKSTKFDKEILKDLADCLVGDEPIEYDGDFYKLVENDIADRGRWTITYEMVFKYNDDFYRTYYNIGATEQQYESPFEYENDLIKCKKVNRVEKTIIVYE